MQFCIQKFWVGLYVITGQYLEQISSSDGVVRIDILGEFLANFWWDVLVSHN